MTRRLWLRRRDLERGAISGPPPLTAGETDFMTDAARRLGPSLRRTPKSSRSLLSRQERATTHSAWSARSFGRFCPVHLWPDLRCPPRRGAILEPGRGIERVLRGCMPATDSESGALASPHEDGDGAPRVSCFWIPLMCCRSARDFAAGASSLSQRFAAGRAATNGHEDGFQGTRVWTRETSVRPRASARCRTADAVALRAAPLDM